MPPRSFDVVHIGLGKTATTSLQHKVFPLATKLGIFDSYNESELFGRIKHLLRNNADAEEIEFISSYLAQSDSRHLISHEGLVHWNPEYWVKARNRNLNLFGCSTTIIITLRQPEEFLRSLYQQKVQSGNVIEPQAFFLKSKQYKKSQGFIKAQLCEKFPVDKFSLRHLVELYSESFDHVIVVPYSQIHKFDYFREVGEVTCQQLRELETAFSSTTRKNNSFSKKAMKLTLSRERMLNKIGLKTLGSHDILHELKNEHPVAKKSLSSKPQSYVSTRVRSLYTNLCKVITWNYQMEKGIVKLFKYERYKLPNELDLGCHHSENLEFYNWIETSENGYKVFGKGKPLEINQNVKS